MSKILFKVQFMECDSWSGMECFNKYYDSEEEAKVAVKECNDKYMNKSCTPDYYVYAEYKGEDYV